MLKKFALSLVLGVALTTPLSAQTLKVGTEPYYAPFEFIDEQGRLSGFDLELIAAMAAVSGDSVEFYELEFDEIFKKVADGSLDVGISSISYTADRHEKYEFTVPYYNSGVGILCPEEKVEQLTVFHLLADKVLCAQTDTTSAAIAASLSEKVALFPSAELAFNALAEGKCEAMVGDVPVINAYLATHAQSGLKPISQLLSREQFGVIMQKGNRKLEEHLDAALEELRSNGTYQQIYRKYFGDN